MSESFKKESIKERKLPEGCGSCVKPKIDKTAQNWNTPNYNGRERKKVVSPPPRHDNKYKNWVSIEDARPLVP